MKFITATEADYVITWLLQDDKLEERITAGVSTNNLEEWQQALKNDPVQPTLAVHSTLQRLAPGQRRKAWNYIRACRYRQRQRDKRPTYPVYVSKDTHQRLASIRAQLSHGSEPVSDDRVVRYLIGLQKDHKICE